MTSHTSTIDGTTYRPATPSDQGPFVVLGIAEPDSAPVLAARSASYVNGAKRGRELTGKRYRWTAAWVAVEVDGDAAPAPRQSDRQDRSSEAQRTLTITPERIPAPMTPQQLAQLELSIADWRAGARQAYIEAGTELPAELAADLCLMLAAADSLGCVVQFSLAELNQLVARTWVNQATRKLTDAGQAQAAGALLTHTSLGTF